MLAFEESKFVNEVEVWIRFGFTREVEVLDLGFGVLNPVGQKFKLPEFVWNSDSLTEIRLNCDVKAPKRVWIGLLKILSLDRVDISSEAFREVIGGCPLLQDVAITDCQILNKLSFTAPNVKKFRVSMKDCKWKLTVNYPNVRSFDFSGFVEYVELINLSSVKTVAFSVIVDRIEQFKGFRQFKRFLDRIQHAEILMVDKVFFAVLTNRVLENHPCPRNKWKRVVLHTWLSRLFIREVSSLLRYSSCLEELTIHVNDPSEYSCMGVQLTELKHVYYKPYDEDTWSFQRLKQSLKNVTMHNMLWHL